MFHITILTAKYTQVIISIRIFILPRMAMTLEVIGGNPQTRQLRKFVQDHRAGY